MLLSQSQLVIHPSMTCPWGQMLRQVPAPQHLQHHPGWLQNSLDLLGVITAGGCAGTVMWACVLPVDVAKTRWVSCLSLEVQSFPLPYVVCISGAINFAAE